MTGALSARWSVGLPPAEALAVVARELEAALARSGAVPADAVAEDDQGLIVRWRLEAWAGGETSVRLRATAEDGGALLVLEVTGLAEAAGFADDDATAWFTSEVAAHVVRATAPGALGDWLTERRVRRPSGQQARAFYADPRWHWPAFDAVLERLAPSPSDRLIEVGCGGGVFLEAALARGLTAAGVDHSHDMIGLAAERNGAAVGDGRLRLVHGDAVPLPFAPGRFTCATSIGVLLWLPDQRAALAELRRVLAPGGRLVVYTGSPEVAGTPAAPEPFASRLTLLDDEDLAALVGAAGFGDVTVRRPDLRAHARRHGIGDAEAELFAGRYGQLVTASR